MPPQPAETTAGRGGGAQDGPRPGSEGRASALTGLDALGDGLLVIAPDRTLLEVNARFLEMTGFTREDLVGSRPPRPYWPPEEIAAYDALLGRLGDGEEGLVESVVRDVDGRRFPVESSWSHVRDGDGRLIAHLVSVRDITARVALVAAVAESEARFRSVVTGMSEGVVLQADDGRAVLCNEAACEILGLSEEQLLGRDSFDPRWHAVTEDGTPFPGELHPAMLTLRLGIAQRDVIMGVDSPAHGERRWISINSEPVGETDDLGRPASVVATFVDVTERWREHAELRRERDFTRSLLAAMHEALLVIGADGRVLDVNEAFVRLTGFPADRVVGLEPPFPWWPDDAVPEMRRVLAGLMLGAGGTHTLTIQTASGARVRVEASRSRLAGDRGSITGHFVTLRDITAREEAEARVRDSERTLREMVAALPDGVAVVHADGRIGIRNAEAERILGLAHGPAPERLGDGEPDLLDGDGRPLPRRERPVEITMATGRPRRGVVVGFNGRPDGERRWALVSTEPMGARDGLGRPETVLVTLTDITEQRRLQADVRAERDFSRAVLGAIGDAVLVLGSDRTLLDVNDRFCDLLGYARQDLIGLSMPFPWVPPEYAPHLAAAMARADAGEAIALEEAEMLAADGRRIPVEVNRTRLAGPDGALRAYLVTIRDVTARRVADQALRESEERFRHLVENQEDVIVRISPEREVVYASQPSLATLLGEVEPRHLRSRIDPRDLERVEAAHDRVLAGEQGVRCEARLRRADGRVVWVESIGNPVRDSGGVIVGIQVGLRDATERIVRERDAAALQRISERVVSAAPDAEVFAMIAREVADVMEGSAAAVTEFREDKGFAVGYWATGAPPVTAPPHHPVDLSRADTAAGRVRREGRPVVVDGIPPGAGGVVGTGRAPAVTAAVGAPITVDGAVWGAVSVGASGGAFAPGDMERITRFAELATLAIEAADRRRTLVRHATTDALTGLQNRWVFSDLLDLEITRARRHGRPLALAMIDIDHFKDVNDSLGHLAGDRILKGAAAHLRAAARSDDVVARIGGEEFAWILPDAGRDAAGAAAERLRAAIAGWPAAGPVNITVSVGVALFERAWDAAELYRRADAALYRAKALGRDRVVVAGTSAEDSSG